MLSYPAMSTRVLQLASRAVCVALASLVVAPAASFAAGDWPSYGQNASNTRSQADPGSITSGTVGSLQESWASRLSGFQAGVTPPPHVTSTPAVHAGTAYWGDYRGDLYAVDVATGTPKPGWPVAIGRESNVDIRQINSSPAVGDGIVVVSTGSGRLVAVREADGAQLWSTTVDSEPWTVLYGSPVIAGGLVIVGVSSVENAVNPGPWNFHGSIVALDEHTGAIVWRTYTQNPNKGDGPGGSVWSTPAVDLARGTVFVGTGNAYAAPAGDFTDALMALDLKTGAVKWSRQFTRNDVFNYYWGLLGPDRDIGASPNLFRALGHDVVGVGDKSGRYAVLDRDTGDTIWRKQLCVGSHLGGIMTTAAVAHDSVYVTCNSLVDKFELANPANRTNIFRLGRHLGVTRWKQTVPGGTAGAVSEAGGAVFVPNTLGTVRAFDWATGKLLWQARPAGASTRIDYGIAGGISVAEDRVLVPYGYVFDPRKDAPDAVGGVVAYAVPAGVRKAVRQRAARHRQPSALGTTTAGAL